MLFFFIKYLNKIDSCMITVARSKDAYYIKRPIIPFRTYSKSNFKQIIHIKLFLIHLYTESNNLKLEIFFLWDT